MSTQKFPFGVTSYELIGVKCLHMGNMNKIKVLRAQYGKISQDKLADAANTTKSKISKLENGSQELSYSWMKRIASAFTDLGYPTDARDLIPPSNNDDWLQEQTEWLKTLNEEGRQAFEDLKALQDKYFQKGDTK